MKKTSRAGLADLSPKGQMFVRNIAAAIVREIRAELAALDDNTNSEEVEQEFESETADGCLKRIRAPLSIGRR